MPAAPPATPPPAPGSPDVAVVEYDQFIDRKLRQTSWHVKAVSQTARLLIAGVGLLGFLLVAGILEHWLVRGGLSNGARWIFFVALVAAAGWYTIQFLLPFVLRRVNPIYVAQTIEEHTPGLKNSLLNLLFFRERRDEVPVPVYEALEQQAAVRMSEANVDTSADRTQLIRALSIFLVLLTIAGLYKVLSPKDPLATAGRVLMPWADIAPPTRVTIDDIKPGDAEISRGERLEITAVIQGTRDGEPVFLQYTTEDGQSVGRKIPMTPSKSGYRHVCKLPADESTRRPAGVQQGFSYRVAAGDARSKEYRVTLRDLPTIVLERVELDYPEYTGFVRDVKTPGGDLRAIEGTKVTIHAQTNQPIDEAFIDLDADGTSDVPLVVDGDQQRQAAGSFVLAMREDRRTPAQHSYVLRFRNKAGQSSRDAIRYRIDVEPDYAPEIELLAPQEEEVEVRQSETLAIEVDARDPDFALSEVKIRGAGDAVAGGEGGAKDLFDESLLTDEHVGRFWQTWRFTPKEHDLSVGDELTYWAVAKDTRRPEANVAITRRRRIRVIADPPPRDGEQQETGDRGQETGDKGQRAENPQQRNAEDANEPGKPQDQDNQNEETQEGDAQGEGSGQPQGQQQDGGEAGEQGESTGGQGGTDGSAQPANEQPADGQPTGEQQDQPTDGSQPAEGQPDGQGSGEKRPDGQPGNTGTENQPNAQTDPTASDGSDDGTAFETIRRHMEEKETGERQETGEPPSRTADGVRKPGESQPEPSEGQPEPNEGEHKPAEGKREPSEGEPKPADAAPKPGEPEPGDDSPQSEIPDNEPQPTDAPENADPPQPNEPQDGPGREGAAEDRQSEGTGAETKSGEHAGDQEQSRGQQDPKSPGGEQTSPKGESGAGQQPNESQGAPSADDPSVQQRDKPMKDRPAQRKDDQEPPAGLQKNKGQKESDSEGDQGGDKPGGGQEGGGQKANDAGTGSAGQNQAADEGAGKAADPGQGETGDQPGEKETADSKTGKSDGQQKGPGSKSQPGGEKPGSGEQGTGDREQETGDREQETGDREQGTGDREQETGDREQETGDREQETGDREQETGDREQETGDREQETGDREQETGDREQRTGDRGQETDSPSSRTADGVREPDEGAREPSQREPGGDERQSDKNAPDAGEPNQRPPTGQPESTSGGAPTGSGTPGASRPGRGTDTNDDSPPADGNFAGDKANLDYARKQTDLILDRLSDQVDKREVDQELLDELGWSEDDLRRFLDRWNARKQAARGNTDTAIAARRELDAALRSLGLGRQPLRRPGAAGARDNLRELRSAPRAKTPPEFQRQLQAYTRDVAKGRSDETDE